MIARLHALAATESSYDTRYSLHQYQQRLMHYKDFCHWRSAIQWLFCCWLTLTGPIASAVEPLRVRHNFFVDQNSEVLNYKGEVLSLLLEKSKSKFGPYRMEKGPHIDWSQSRAYSQLEAGNLDLISSMTSEEREKSGIPLRYCLYKGLLGVRIGMGTPGTVEVLDRIRTRDELNRVKLGQVFDWPDYTIQTQAGLQVLRLPDLASSIPRLKMGTFQLLPLGIVEVAANAKKYDLATISTWAIAYPTAYYFFVSKTRPELAERLAYGFEQAIKDRSFDQLYAKRIGTLVAAMGLEKRTLFHIHNPLLPQATPLARKELWHPLVTSKLQ
jgi:hypothetical protein